MDIQKMDTAYYVFDIGVIEKTGSISEEPASAVSAALLCGESEYIPDTGLDR